MPLVLLHVLPSATYATTPPCSSKPFIANTRQPMASAYASTNSLSTDRARTLRSAVEVEQHPTFTIPPSTLAATCHGGLATSALRRTQLLGYTASSMQHAHQQCKLVPNSCLCTAVHVCSQTTTTRTAPAHEAGPLVSDVASATFWLLNGLVGHTEHAPCVHHSHPGPVAVRSCLA